MQLPEKKCIYTVITGGYDALFPPLSPQPGWDLLCFTDDAEMTSAFWDVRPLPNLPELAGLENDPARAARMVKILPHKFLGEYDYSVYIDGNRVLKGDMSAYVQAHEGKLLCLAPVAADAYAAAEQLVDYVFNDDPLEVAPKPELSEEEKKQLRRQMKVWREKGLPKGGGLPGTAVLGRFHNDEKVARAMEAWAREVLRGSAFDEPAFAFACHRQGLEWTAGLRQRVMPGQVYSDAAGLAMPVPHRRLLLGDDPPPPTEYPKNPPPPGGPYGGYPLVLTIGVPVSNQIKTIRRCLEGIKPLLDGLDAELVVVDTGSTDGTVEVCREFGARVIDFPWINDMSAARNTAIRAARGMWYMSIDDDEWFDDVSDFLHFFKTPRLYENKQGAFYNQHNFRDEFGTQSNRALVLRLARMTPDIHFEGRIHDAMIFPKDPDLYYMEADAHHFGFAYVAWYKTSDKVRRNLKSLRYDVAQNPNYYRFSYQLMKEYVVLSMHGRSTAMAFWTLSVLRNRPDPELHITLATKGFGTMGLVSAKAYRQALDFYQSFVVLEEFGLGDQLTLLCSMMEAYRALCMFDEVLACVAQYDKKCRQFLALSEGQQNLETQLLQQSRFNEEGQKYVQSMRAYTDMSRLDSSQLKLVMLKRDMLEMMGENAAYRKAVMDYIFAGRRWNLLAMLTGSFVAADMTDKLYDLYLDMDERMREGQWSSVLAALERGGVAPGAYQAALRLRGKAKADDEADALLAELVEGLDQYVNAPARYARLLGLYEAVRLGLGTGPLLARVQIPDVDFIYDYLSKAKTEFMEKVYDELFEWQKTPDPGAGEMGRYLRMRMGLLVFTRREREIEQNPENYKQHFYDIVDRVLAWEGDLYAPGLLEGEGSPLLPTRVRTFCLIREAGLHRAQGNAVQALREYRQAIDLDVSLGKVLKLLAEECGEEANRQNAAPPARSPEFEMLFQNIKPKIEQLIDAGMANEAIPMITQLDALVPGDADIQALKVKAGLLPPN